MCFSYVSYVPMCLCIYISFVYNYSQAPDMACIMTSHNALAGHLFRRDTLKFGTTGAQQGGTRVGKHYNSNNL